MVMRRSRRRRARWRRWWHGGDRDRGGAPAGAQDDSASGGEQHPADRLGAGPADAEPVRRPRRGGLHRLGASTGTCWSTSDPKDLTPGARHRRELGRLRRQEDGHLQARSRTRKWSDGKPITSKDVKYSLDVLGGERRAVHQLHRQRHARSTRRTTDTVVDPHQASPTRGSSAACSSTSCPSTSGARCRSRSSRAPTSRRCRWSAAARTSSPSSSAGGSSGWSATRTSAGPKPEFDEIQFIKYGNQDAVERALQLGEIDLVAEVAADRLRAARRASRTSRRSARRRPSFTRARLQPLPGADLPGREVQPGRPGPRRCARRSPTRSTASASTRSPRAAPRSSATGSCPTSTSPSTSSPSRTTRSTSTRPTRCSTTPAGRRAATASATKGGETLVVQPLRALGVAVQHPGGEAVAEKAKPIGVEFKVQVVSVDKLTELTIRKVDGKPAPDFDTFIWGWGGDPYDPSFLLSLLTTRRDRRLVGLVLLQPRVRQALRRSRPASSTPPQRKAIIQQMVAITQRDLPYLVLTVRPEAAGLPDRHARRRQAGLSRATTGDIICDQVGYEPLAAMTPGARPRRRRRRRRRRHRAGW